MRAESKTMRWLPLMIFADWGIYGAPETFLVDGSGIVRWKHVGALSDAIVHDELLPALAQAERAK
jgi:cytochrome c biogenesis protein CcmG/thiol:disulfide interchange protein DsbE